MPRMSFTQPDLSHLTSYGPWFTKDHKSNSNFSYAALNLYSNMPSTDSLKKPNTDHWRFCEKMPLRSDGQSDSPINPVCPACSKATLENSLQEAEATDRYFATYLKAFALIYVLPEVHWSAGKIGLLLADGMELFRSRSEINQSENTNREENQILQSGNEEKRIKRNFNIEGHIFTLSLEPRYLGEATRPLRQHTIRNLRHVLQSFLKSSRYCLLLTRVGDLLIWRRKNSFYVLDAEDNRVAMLVCLKTIDNVVNLASNMSGITPKDVFTIRELLMIRLETPNGRIFLRESSYRSMELKEVNKSYAYLKATLHLSLSQNETVKNRSSLMVAVTSILASKIYQPTNWDVNILNRLIFYGLEFCRNYWTDCLKNRQPIDLDTFPTQLRLGQFVVDFMLMPNVRSGDWTGCVDIIGTEFETNLREALEGYGNAVFQINNQMYAMWAKDGVYHLLDPYRHTVIGTHVAEDQGEDAKWATVRMFRDQLSMLTVFHLLLKESNCPSAYSLHTVIIRNLRECPQGYVLSPLPEDVDSFDVKSLNEPIMFSEQLGAFVEDHFQAEISKKTENIEIGIKKDKKGLGAFVEDHFQEEIRENTENKEIGIKKDLILEKRQAAGAGDAKMFKETKAKAALTYSRRSSPKKDIISKPVASKSKPRSLKTSGNINTKSNPMGKNQKGSLKVVKAINKTKVVTQESKSTPRRMKIKQVITKIPTNKSPNEFSFRKGAAFFSVFKVKRPATIKKPGRIVKATSSRLPRDSTKKAPKPGLLHNKGPSNPKVASKSESTSRPMRAVKDILQQSTEVSSCFGVAPMAPPPSAINVSIELDQKPNKLNNKELHKADMIKMLKKSEDSSMLSFPGFNREPQPMAVLRSESGTVESLSRLLGSALKIADRVFTITPWGNYVVFRNSPNNATPCFYLFGGCICDFARFRHLDLSRGTAGLIEFQTLSEMVCHMIDLREKGALNKLRIRAKRKQCGKHPVC